MRTYKRLLLGLLILISITMIFNTPGIGNLEIFNNFISKQEDVLSWVSMSKLLSAYPPGTFISLFSIVTSFTTADKILFYKQNAWVAHKFLLYSFYLLSFAAFILFSKLTKSKRFSLLDVSIYFFGSLSILLLSVALSFFEILAVPFFVMSASFLFQKKFNLSVVFYIVGLVFNWSLLVFSLPFFLYVLKKSKLKLVPLLGFIVIPSLVLVFILFGNPSLKADVVFGYPWFLSAALENVLPALFSGGVMITTLAFLLSSTFSVISRLKFGKYLIPVVIFSLSIFWPSSLSSIFVMLFLVIYFRLLQILAKSRDFTDVYFLKKLFSLFLVYTLFISGPSVGVYIWLTILALMIYLRRSASFEKANLLLVNIATFLSVFIFYGTAGLPPVLGSYFEFFHLVIGALYLSYSVWFIRISSSKQQVSHIKIFVILYMIAINFALITATGTGTDTTSWSQYTTAVANDSGGNPFLGQTLVDQPYPPLSTAIMGVFASTWKFLIGISQRYAVSTKLSIFIFYVLTLISYLKFAVPHNEKSKLKYIDKLLITLTTYSIIIQTQGFADINIYVLPTLFAAIFTLFRKKYFWSGLLLGLTVSIKWQPVILIPLFGATLVNFDNDIRTVFKRSLEFLVGFLPIPMLAWYLLLIQPLGLEAVQRSFRFIINGAAMLSGQALNLNWIVTYAIHYFQPYLDFSLEHLGGLNRQIPTSIAPFIFQGYLFIAAAFLILLRYWLMKKKNQVNFLSAAVMIFFSHFMLNKSAYEKHIFYVVTFMLFLYLVRPTKGNRYLLILFDIMTAMNLVFFYGFTGGKWFNRLFLGFDITVLFSLYYFLIFIWVLWRYFKKDGLLFDKGSV